jgi:hypothetical protein
MGVLTTNGVSKRLFGFTPKSKAPTCLLGVAKTMCEASLFFAQTMVISSIEPTAVFHLTTTLCESGGTIYVVVKLEDTFVPPIIFHPVFKTNHIMKLSKVQPKSWHAARTKTS